MKKILFALSVTTLLTLNSCKNGANSSSPTAALKAMAADTKKADFKLMSTHMCKDDREMMEKMLPLMESFAKMSGKSLEETMKEKIEQDAQFNFNDVEFKNEKVNGDKATVDVFNKKENKSETINFTKENGAWKICMGIAEKANAEMNANTTNDPNAPKNMNEAIEKLNSPEVKEQMQKMQDAIKKMKPEDIEKFKKAAEEMQKIKQ